MTDLILPPTEMQALAQLPAEQVEKYFLANVEQADCPIRHLFGPGIYIREVHFPAGIMVIGHEHKDAHTNLFLSGKLNLYQGDGSYQTLEAPAFFVSPPGRKMAYTLTPCVWQNIYATEETDVEALEDMLFVKSSEFESAVASRTCSDYSRHIADRRDFRKFVKEQGQGPTWIEFEGFTTSRESANWAIGESAIAGKGVHATSNILAGAPLGYLRQNNLLTHLGEYLNHSVMPNAKVERAASGDLYVTLVRSVAGMAGGFLGDEITIDYRDTMRVAATFEEQT